MPSDVQALYEQFMQDPDYIGKETLALAEAKQRVIQSMNNHKALSMAKSITPMEELLEFLIKEASFRFNPASKEDYSDYNGFIDDSHEGAASFETLLNNLWDELLTFAPEGAGKEDVIAHPEILGQAVTGQGQQLMGELTRPNVGSTGRRAATQRVVDLDDPEVQQGIAQGELEGTGLDYESRVQGRRPVSLLPGQDPKNPLGQEILHELRRRAGTDENALALVDQLTNAVQTFNATQLQRAAPQRAEGTRTIREDELTDPRKLEGKDAPTPEGKTQGGLSVSFNQALERGWFIPPQGSVLNKIPNGAEEWRKLLAQVITDREHYKDIATREGWPITNGGFVRGYNQVGTEAEDGIFNLPEGATQADVIKLLQDKGLNHRQFEKVLDGALDETIGLSPQGIQAYNNQQQILQRLNLLTGKTYTDMREAVKDLQGIIDNPAQFSGGFLKPIEGRKDSLTYQITGSEPKEWSEELKEGVSEESPKLRDAFEVGFEPSPPTTQEEEFDAAQKQQSSSLQQLKNHIQAIESGQSSFTQPEGSGTEGVAHSHPISPLQAYRMHNIRIPGGEGWSVLQPQMVNALQAAVAAKYIRSKHAPQPNPEAFNKLVKETAEELGWEIPEDSEIPESVHKADRDWMENFDSDSITTTNFTRSAKPELSATDDLTGNYKIGNRRLVDLIDTGEYPNHAIIAELRDRAEKDPHRVDRYVMQQARQALAGESVSESELSGVGHETSRGAATDKSYDTGDDPIGDEEEWAENPDRPATSSTLFDLSRDRWDFAYGDQHSHMPDQNKFNLGSGEGFYPSTSATYNWAYSDEPFSKAKPQETRFEVSTEGSDFGKQFSAKIAKLPNGRTIEDVYQKDIKRGAGRGKVPEGMSKEDLHEAYTNLWRQWADANPQKLAELAAVASRKTLTDKFAYSTGTGVSQARSLAEILQERHGTVGIDDLLGSQFNDNTATIKAKNNKTISELYKALPDNRKGHKAYTDLWEQWANENTELMDQLANVTREGLGGASGGGKTLVTRSHIGDAKKNPKLVSSARSLSEILSGRKDDEGNSKPSRWSNELKWRFWRDKDSSKTFIPMQFNFTEGGEEYNATRILRNALAAVNPVDISRKPMTGNPQGQPPGFGGYVSNSPIERKRLAVKPSSYPGEGDFDVEALHGHEDYHKWRPFMADLIHYGIPLEDLLSHDNSRGHRLWTPNTMFRGMQKHGALNWGEDGTARSRQKTEWTPKGKRPDFSPSQLATGVSPYSEAMLTDAGVAPLFPGSRSIDGTARAPIPIDEATENWTRDSVKADPNRLYLFGDNLLGWGTQGQAVIRSSRKDPIPNVHGIPTKRSPYGKKSDYKDPEGNSAFMSDDDLENNKRSIDAAFDAIHDKGYERVVISKDGLGTGLSQLKEKAPQTFAYIQQKLEELANGTEGTGPREAYNANHPASKRRQAMLAARTPEQKQAAIEAGYTSSEHAMSRMRKTWHDIMGGDFSRNNPGGVGAEDTSLVTQSVEDPITGGQVSTHNFDELQEKGGIVALSPYQLGSLSSKLQPSRAPYSKVSYRREPSGQWTGLWGIQTLQGKDEKSRRTYYERRPSIPPIYTDRSKENEELIKPFRDADYLRAVAQHIVQKREDNREEGEPSFKELDSQRIARLQELGLIDKQEGDSGNTKLTGTDIISSFQPDTEGDIPEARTPRNLMQAIESIRKELSAGATVVPTPLHAIPEKVRKGEGINVNRPSGVTKDSQEHFGNPFGVKPGQGTAELPRENTSGREYVSHSGGALGSDQAWDDAGQDYGVTSNHYHMVGASLKEGERDTHRVPRDNQAYLDEAVAAVSNVISRPVSQSNADLFRRNIVQVDSSDAVFAVSRIGATDYDRKQPKGKQNTGVWRPVARGKRHIVDGGTAWAVHHAILVGKPVHVFDVLKDGWYTWNFDKNKWDEEDTPTLTKNFAGIGTRRLTENGWKAIQDVYEKTFGASGRSRTQQVSDAYRDWLNGTDHTDVEQERRQWILDQINNKELDGKNLLYYTRSVGARGLQSHADVLANLSNEKHGRNTPMERSDGADKLLGLLGDSPAGKAFQRLNSKDKKWVYDRLFPRTDTSVSTGDIIYDHTGTPHRLEQVSENTGTEENPIHTITVQRMRSANIDETPDNTTRTTINPNGMFPVGNPKEAILSSDDAVQGETFFRFDPTKDRSGTDPIVGYKPGGTVDPEQRRPFERQQAIERLLGNGALEEHGPVSSSSKADEINKVLKELIAKVTGTGSIGEDGKPAPVNWSNIIKAAKNLYKINLPIPSKFGFPEYKETADDLLDHYHGKKLTKKIKKELLQRYKDGHEGIDKDFLDKLGIDPEDDEPEGGPEGAIPTTEPPSPSGGTSDPLANVPKDLSPEQESSGNVAVATRTAMEQAAHNDALNRGFIGHLGTLHIGTDGMKNGTGDFIPDAHTVATLAHHAVSPESYSDLDASPFEGLELSDLVRETEAGIVPHPDLHNILGLPSTALIGLDDIMKAVGEQTGQDTVPAAPQNFLNNTDYHTYNNMGRPMSNYTDEEIIAAAAKLSSIPSIQDEIIKRMRGASDDGVGGGGGDNDSKETEGQEPPKIGIVPVQNIWQKHREHLADRGISHEELDQQGLLTPTSGRGVGEEQLRSRYPHDIRASLPEELPTDHKINIRDHGEIGFSDIFSGPNGKRMLAVSLADGSRIGFTYSESSGEKGEWIPFSGFTADGRKPGKDNAPGELLTHAAWQDRTIPGGDTQGVLKLISAALNRRDDLLPDENKLMLAGYGGQHLHDGEHVRTERDTPDETFGHRFDNSNSPVTALQANALLGTQVSKAANDTIFSNFEGENINTLGFQSAENHLTAHAKRAGYVNEGRYHSTNLYGEEAKEEERDEGAAGEDGGDGGDGNQSETSQGPSDDDENIIEYMKKDPHWGMAYYSVGNSVWQNRFNDERESIPENKDAADERLKLFHQNELTTTHYKMMSINGRDAGEVYSDRGTALNDLRSLLNMSAGDAKNGPLHIIHDDNEEDVKIADEKHASFIDQVRQQNLPAIPKLDKAYLEEFRQKYGDDFTEVLRVSPSADKAPIHVFEDLLDTAIGKLQEQWMSELQDAVNNQREGFPTIGAERSSNRVFYKDPKTGQTYPLGDITAQSSDPTSVKAATQQWLRSINYNEPGRINTLTDLGTLLAEAQKIASTSQSVPHTKESLLQKLQTTSEQLKDIMHYQRRVWDSKIHDPIRYHKGADIPIWTSPLENGVDADGKPTMVYYGDDSLGKPRPFTDSQAANQYSRKRDRNRVQARVDKVKNTFLEHYNNTLWQLAQSMDIAPDQMYGNTEFTDLLRKNGLLLAPDQSLHQVAYQESLDDIQTNAADLDIYYNKDWDGWQWLPVDPENAKFINAYHRGLGSIAGTPVPSASEIFPEGKVQDKHPDTNIGMPGNEGNQVWADAGIPNSGRNSGPRVKQTTSVETLDNEARSEQGGWSETLPEPTSSSGSRADTQRYQQRKKNTYWNPSGSATHLDGINDTSILSSHGPEDVNSPLHLNNIRDVFEAIPHNNKNKTLEKQLMSALKTLDSGEFQEATGHDSTSIAQALRDTHGDVKELAKWIKDANDFKRVSKPKIARQNRDMKQNYLREEGWNNIIKEGSLSEQLARRQQEQGPTARITPFEATQYARHVLGWVSNLINEGLDPTQTSGKNKGLAEKVQLARELIQEAHVTFGANLDRIDEERRQYGMGVGITKPFGSPEHMQEALEKDMQLQRQNADYDRIMQPDSQEMMDAVDSAHLGHDEFHEYKAGDESNATNHTLDGVELEGEVRKHLDEKTRHEQSHADAEFKRDVATSSAARHAKNRDETRKAKNAIGEAKHDKFIEWQMARIERRSDEEALKAEHDDLDAQYKKLDEQEKSHNNDAQIMRNRSRTAQSELEEHRQNLMASEAAHEKASQALDEHNAKDPKTYAREGEQPSEPSTGRHIGSLVHMPIGFDSSGKARHEEVGARLKDLDDNYVYPRGHIKDKAPTILGASKDQQDLYNKTHSQIISGELTGPQKEGTLEGLRTHFRSTGHVNSDGLTPVDHPHFGKSSEEINNMAKDPLTHQPPKHSSGDNLTKLSNGSWVHLPTIQSYQRSLKADQSIFHPSGLVHDNEGNPTNQGLYIHHGGVIPVEPKRKDGDYSGSGTGGAMSPHELVSHQLGHSLHHLISSNDKDVKLVSPQKFPSGGSPVKGDNDYHLISNSSSSMPRAGNSLHSGGVMKKIRDVFPRKVKEPSAAQSINPPSHGVQASSQLTPSSKLSEFTQAGKGIISGIGDAKRQAQQSKIPFLETTDTSSVSGALGSIWRTGKNLRVSNPLTSLRSEYQAGKTMGMGGSSGQPSTPNVPPSLEKSLDKLKDFLAEAQTK